MSRFEWSPEKVEILKRLKIKEGLTSTVIAERLGVSRSSVSGKLNRLGLLNKKKKEPYPIPKTLFDLKENECRFPQGSKPDYDFCAKPVSEIGDSYCEHHQGVAYLIRPKR